MKTLHPRRLNIGPRLILGGAIIILSMLAADAIVLWQFRMLRDQAVRLSDIDRKLVAVLRVHTSVLAFHDRLDALADSENFEHLVAEAGPLRLSVLRDIRRATGVLNVLPADLQDPTILPTLRVIQSALPSQLDAIITLAAAGDWRAVNLRLVNQIGPLTSVTAALVEKVEREVGAEQAQIAASMQRVQRRVFVIVPATALLTLLVAGTLGLAITRSITRPLDRLVEGSKALARGEFQHRVAISGDDELAHLSGVFNDTTRRLRELFEERHRAEAALRRSEASLHEAQRISHTGSWRHDMASGTVTLSDEGSRIWGVLPDDAPGTDYFFGRMHPDDAAVVARAYAMARETKSEFMADFRLVRPDGTVRNIHSVGHPVVDASGELVEFVGAAMDITDRRRAEEALRQAQADLAHVSRVTTMGELTASLAHEVRQPIAAAVMNANSCVRWLAHAPPDIAEARAAAMRILEDGRRATDIISRIRLVFTKGAPQHERVDVNELVHEMIVLLRSEATRYDVAMRTELADDLPPVMGDRVQLQQVLMNLIVNAIDAMSAVQGTRELVITSQRGESGEVQVCVSDTGVGLPALRPDQIFKAFFTTKAHGIGMGLSISRSIVESHGGELWATEHAPRGATFCLTLPARVDGA